MLRRTFPVLVVVIALLGVDGLAASARFKDAVKARLENGYAVVVFANGSKTVAPLASLSEDDRAWLTSLSSEKPLVRGKSEILVVKESPKIKKTIQTATTAGTLETLQLCPPNVPRDQIGATCMLYGRVHWMDIAGYYLDAGAIYKVSNGVDPAQPWSDRRYLQGLHMLLAGFTPAPWVHPLPAHETDPFEWARSELRQGRPILAAFPKEIWQALPPGFVAARPWSGGNIGHQIVINGFTWDRAKKQGTFHIINSWHELPEFDLTTEAAKGGALVIECSLSPKGELQPEAVKEIVKSITFIRTAGSSNLYEVETNLGRRKIAATSEAAARALIEERR